MELEQLENRHRVASYTYKGDWVDDKTTAITEALLHQLGEIKALAGYLSNDSQSTVDLYTAVHRMQVAIQNTIPEDV